MRRRRGRKQSGITMVEFVAAMVFGLPPIMLMLYATLEANLFFTIRTNLDVAVRRAAQVLINNYVTTGGTEVANASNTDLPSNLAFQVQTADGHYFIKNGAKQFTWTWDPATANAPATVTVTVTYPTTKGAANGLLPFPNPDPLNIGANFTIVESGTFSVPPL